MQTKKAKRVNETHDLTYPELAFETLGQIPGYHTAQNSGAFYRIFQDVYLPGTPESDKQLTCRVSWAYTQWMRSDKPIIRLSAQLQEFLLDIDLPDTLDELPPMPWDGFWVSLHGFLLQDEKGESYEVDGVYLAKDTMRMREKVQPDGSRKTLDEPEQEPGILVIGVSKGRTGVQSLDSYQRDDILHYFGIAPGSPLREDTQQYGMGTEEIARIAVNLLLLWSAQGNPMQLEERIPQKPKSPKKVKRLARRGKSVEKYWFVSLDPAYSTPTQSRPDDGYDGPLHLTTVRGHYRTYWVRDTEGAAVLDTKKNATGKTLRKVRRFIYPHKAWRRGEAPERNVYEAL
jgi:hypothetical protein